MAFRCAILGATGGPREDNLSCFLVSKADTFDFVALDAGTLLAGIEKLFEKNEKFFKEASIESQHGFLKEHVRGYLISHSHLDHLAGLVLCSQVDSKKPIMALKATLEAIKTSIFNNVIWPNFSDSGSEPCLRQYSYQELPLKASYSIEKSGLTVESFLLAHHKNVFSTAFLLQDGQDYLLYFGDTAADSVSQKGYMKEVWQRVAPLVLQDRLKAIFLECSYADSDRNAYRDSHLTSSLMMEELKVLASLAKRDLSNVTLFVTHRKEQMDPKVGLKAIEKELHALNTVAIRLIFPTQGEMYLV